MIILSLQLPQQKLSVMFSGVVVPKASVTASAFEKVWQFLVIEVQTVPLMLAHFSHLRRCESVTLTIFWFSFAKIFSHCRLARTITTLRGSTEDFLATWSACLYLINVITSSYSKLPYWWQVLHEGGCTLRCLKNGIWIHPCESTRTDLRPVTWQMAPTPIGGVRRFVSNQIKPYLYNMDNVMPCQTLKLSCQHIKFNKTICWDFFGTKSI